MSLQVGSSSQDDDDDLNYHTPDKPVPWKDIPPNAPKAEAKELHIQLDAEAEELMLRKMHDIWKRLMKKPNSVCK
ncbi:hypothetical protein ECG_05200 [Echinococcus granulosus]|uniref:Expressed conserved protein n=1 Tax=Echinococcus granulosus TaxID=6210 RepID=A0A068WEB8_ECHGR|nr:hypothetical protein ECG_05200 [Echinococcus granulosus]CDS18100.1 hypothetical protein EgrG_000584600 [Echinococcus granulosus]